MVANNTLVVENVNTCVVCFPLDGRLDYPVMEMTYGQRLAAARKNKKLSQMKLAELSGVGQGTISKIERGDQDCSTYDVELSFYLGVHPMWLKFGDSRFIPEWLGGGANDPLELFNTAIERSGLNQDQKNIFYSLLKNFYSPAVSLNSQKGSFSRLPALTRRESDTKH